jgi:hypothetical protein
MGAAPWLASPMIRAINSPWKEESSMQVFPCR